MANFLSRLAARATGTATVAKPVVPTLFSSESGLERSEPPSEMGAEGLANPGESSLISREAALPKQEQAAKSVPETDDPLSGFHPLYKEHPAHHESLPVAELELPIKEQPAFSHTAPDAAPAENKTYVPGRISSSLPPAEEKLLRNDLIQAPLPVVPETQPDRKQQSLTAPKAPTTIPAERRPVLSRRDQMAATPPEAPVVRVTIGRIDVRAQFSAPAPTTSATRHPRPPALSLEEYLKQRREGKR